MIRGARRLFDASKEMAKIRPPMICTIGNPFQGMCIPANKVVVNSKAKIVPYRLKDEYKIPLKNSSSQTGPITAAVIKK